MMIFAPMGVYSNVICYLKLVATTVGPVQSKEVPDVSLLGGLRSTYRKL